MPTIPKPLTSTASKPELEVVWNGVHHNRDADLLTPIGAPIEKRIAIARPPKRLDATDLVDGALPTREAQAVTIAELIAKTGLPLSSVNNALYTLKHRGRAKTAPDRELRAAQRYWRPVDPTVSPDASLVGGVGDW